MSAICPALIIYADGFRLTCDLAPGHPNTHHDPIRLLTWGPASTTVYLDLPETVALPDDPPEVDPEDAEAQRTAETYADAADEPGGA